MRDSGYEIIRAKRTDEKVIGGEVMSSFDVKTIHCAVALFLWSHSAGLNHENDLHLVHYQPQKKPRLVRTALAGVPF